MDTLDSNTLLGKIKAILCYELLRRPPRKKDANMSHPQKNLKAHSEQIVKKVQKKPASDDKFHDKSLFCFPYSEMKQTS